MSKLYIKKENIIKEPTAGNIKELLERGKYIICGDLKDKENLESLVLENVICKKDGQYLVFEISSSDTMEQFKLHVGNEIIVNAIDAKTDIFLWGVKLEIIDDDNFKYTTLDWKAYVDEIKSIDTCCDAEKLFKDTYKKFLEDKVNAYAEIWYFQNLQIKDLFTEDDFMELVKKSSRFVCKTDGKAVSTIDYHTVKQILFKEDEEKCYAYNRIWKEFVNGLDAYMKVQTEKVLNRLNGEVI